MSLSTRKKAKLAGETMYFTGKPCKQGHVAKRRTHNGECVKCCAASNKKWRESHPDRYKSSVSTWQQNNYGKVLLKNRNYQIRKLNRTPTWLTPLDHLEMESIYRYCSALRNCGLDYHVDHIIPLRGKMVSGLHVPSNLQVIPASENHRKLNRYAE